MSKEREALRELVESVKRTTDDKGFYITLTEPRLRKAMESARTVLQSQEGSEPEVDIEAALLTMYRRDYLFKASPLCPKCQEPQVQCVDWQVVPSQWKCRECHSEFIFEPSAASESQEAGGNKDQLG